MKKSTISKKEIIEKITALAAQHHVSAQEINTALNAPKSNTETLMKLFAYLGGIFIFSGLSIYIGIFWLSMSSAMKIMITFGVGVVLYILAIVLPRYHKNNENMLTPLFLTATFFQTTGLFIVFSEFKVWWDIRVAALFIFGAMLIQQLATFKTIKRPSLLFMSLCFWCAFFITLLDLLHASEKTISILIGLSLLGIAYRLDKRHYKSLASFWYFIGSILFLNGLFDALRNSMLEFGFFIISGLMLYFSTLIKNRTLLFVSTLSALGYIGYFTSKHFMHSAAWSILLVLLGLICFGVGVMVLRISKKFGVKS